MQPKFSHTRKVTTENTKAQERKDLATGVLDLATGVLNLVHSLLK